MEQGTIIALVSLVTTAAITIWSKIIDAKQKANDHKFSLRTIYVTKKIDAGQNFTIFNNLRINRLNIRDEYLRELIDKGTENKNLETEIKELEDKLNNMSYTGGSLTGLYFDIENLINVSYDLTDKINEEQAKYDALSKSNNSPNGFREIAVRILSLNSELQSIHRQMNAFIRDNLSKYDII